MAKPIFVLNGPNLNMLGKRQPEIYGQLSLDDVAALTAKRAERHDLKIDFRQSNSEGELIGWIQEARETAAGIIINGAGLTHTSIALLDALQAAELPAIEVHFSNIFRREHYRRHSYVSEGVNGVICGLGATGYELAVDALANLLADTD